MSSLQEKLDQIKAILDEPADVSEAVPGLEMSWFVWTNEEKPFPFPVYDRENARKAACEGRNFQGSKIEPPFGRPALIAEIDKVKALDAVTVKTYRRGRYARMMPELAVYLLAIADPNAIQPMDMSAGFFPDPFLSEGGYFAGKDLQQYLDFQKGLATGSVYMP